MATATITHLRDLVRTKNYVVSHHAADEFEDDNLTILDLESIVLTGAIIKRQHDRKAEETVVKIGLTGTIIFITVYVV